MDLNTIRDRAKTVGAQFLAVVEMAGYPAGWEAVHHGLAAIDKGLAAAAQEQSHLKRLVESQSTAAHDGEMDEDDLRWTVGALRLALKAERKARVEARDDCRSLRSGLTEAENTVNELHGRARRLKSLARKRGAALRAAEERDRSSGCAAEDGPRPSVMEILRQSGAEKEAAERELQEWLLDVKSQGAENNRALRARVADMESTVGELEDDNRSLRAENDRLRQQMEAARVNREFLSAVTTEIRPQRGPTLADVLAALPPGGKLKFEAPAWEEDCVPDEESD